MSRTIFIGDVHGCREELVALIGKLNPEGGDRVIFVGDLVDKGPDSLGVLRYVRELLGVLPGSCVVAGNHEEKALRFHKSGKLDKLKDQSWVHEATDEDWAFIEAMPLTWHDPKPDIRVIHGGIFPALLEKHPDAFEKIEARGAAWHKGGGKVMNRARRMLRVRYVGEDSGDMLALFDNKPGDPFWADVYDGSQGFVIYGHSPFLDGMVKVNSDRAIGIDTGCVFGARLTAYVVEDDGEGGEITEVVQVDALKQYAEPIDED
jgi:diadenosine tetraphosphatase ApaH/serine/threonine PP2A family protein phosphatase